MSRANQRCWMTFIVDPPCAAMAQPHSPKECATQGRRRMGCSDTVGEKGPLWRGRLVAVTGDHHGLELQPVRFAQALGRRLELAAGGEDVAAARGTDGRGITGPVDEFGEFFDLLPVR